MSQAAIAAKAGVSQPSIWQIENGGGVDGLTLYRLADALGVTCDYLRPFIDPAAAAAEPAAPRIVSKRK